MSSPWSAAASRAGQRTARACRRRGLGACGRLAALRTNLEILFDAELSDRPALETERKPCVLTATGIANTKAHANGSTASPRCGPKSLLGARTTARSSTFPKNRWLHRRGSRSRILPGTAYTYQPAGSYETPGANRAAAAYEAPRRTGGTHRRRGEQAARAQRGRATPPTGWAAPAYHPRAGRSANPGALGTPREPTSEADGWVAPSGAAPASPGERYEPQPPRRSHRRQEAPPQPEPPFVPHPRGPSRRRNTGWGAAPPAKRPSLAAVSSEGEWLPPERLAVTGIPNWAKMRALGRGNTTTRRPAVRTPISEPTSAEGRGRHSNAVESASQIQRIRSRSANRSSRTARHFP